MDMDPGEGTSDGRVRRKANKIEVEIKQEPEIKEEPSEGNEFGLVTGWNERFASDATTATSNVELVDESENEFDSNDVKEEVKCEEEKSDKWKDSSANLESSENVSNARGDQNDEPVVESNVNRKGLNSGVKGKRRDGSRKQTKRTIPRNKAAKKRKEHKCHVCGYVTSQKWRLIRHIRIHTGERPYKCDECSKSFAQKSDLIRHKKTHSGEKQFECHVCLKSFAQKQHLNVHLRTHFDELPYSCLKCGQRFAGEEAKQLHEKRCKHRQYECYLCDYKCFAKHCLKDHMQAKHTGEHRFQCEICGKKFIYRNHFSQHLAIHSDQFPFGCSKCRRGFTIEDDKIAHENVCRCRQYQCYICEAFNQRKGHLRNHKRVHHTGEKPFHCKWCDKCFIRKYEVEKHMKRIHCSKK
ncbi:zinc finger protein 436-like [Sitodiplosis mosellana]|uniref:zinc finger protein 436-like n=1 Tax=Sitodiplosis mosellana TaxID=263140 RepID=UPI002443E548|nr:zinc finger protein 436-like [Sitodiplosis mosellana]